MASRIARFSGAVAGIAVAGLICATAASATTTWTVKAGTAAKGTIVAITGRTTGTTPQIHFKDTTSGQTLTCASGTAPGTTKVGSGLSGTGIGHVNGPKTTWKTCKGPGGLVFTVTGAQSWSINAKSYSSGVTSGNITNIKATVTDPGVCTFTATGSVNIKYSNSTHILAVPGGPTLSISGVSGCLGIINNGDHASFTAKYALKANNTAYNPIKITSP